jgi:rRNA-processing protein FCF1
MKLAIADACIFIDLYDLELTNQFFSLELEFHTSLDVVKELYIHQQQLLSAFQSVGKLIVHNIKAEDKNEIIKINYPKSLSESDKSVLFLASKLNAIVISSDKTVRNTANKNAIDYHGMLWIFDQFVDQKILTKSEASLKLKSLINSNIVFQNNKILVNEINYRLSRWNKD